MSELRVGIGVDAHAFSGAKQLVLGGVEFPGEPGLAGHSDGDVVTHALIDALLGAANIGDIGTFFPSDDPAWAGASSLDLLARAYGRSARGRLGARERRLRADRRAAAARGERRGAGRRGSRLCSA